MKFDLNIVIGRPVQEVFAFLRDIDAHERDPQSPVLSLEKTTVGPVDVGSRYREVVQMLPFYSGIFLSEITRFEPPDYLGMDWSGPGMEGDLTYFFEVVPQGTRLTQRENVYLHGIVRFFTPLIRAVLGSALQNRLREIKTVLERDGWPPG